MCILYEIMCRYCCKSSSANKKNSTFNRHGQSEKSPPVTVPPEAQIHNNPYTSPPVPVHIYSETSSQNLHNSNNSESDTETQPKENYAALGQDGLHPLVHPKLEDFGSSDDLNQLTVKQLKILLTLNRVNFRGCIEKSELMEKVHRLWADNQIYKNISENTSTEQLCKICMDSPLECVLLECGHLASCVNCGKQLAECPICRQYVVRVVRIFKA